MRNTIFTFIGVALLVGFVACDDWTSPEKLDVENEAVGDLYSKRDSIKWAEEEKRHKENEAAYEKYLENLRAYKSTKHQCLATGRSGKISPPVSFAGQHGCCFDMGKLALSERRKNQRVAERTGQRNQSHYRLDYRRYRRPDKMGTRPMARR